jgi:hypothetical protein
MKKYYTELFIIGCFILLGFLLYHRPKENTTNQNFDGKIDTLVIRFDSITTIEKTITKQITITNEIHDQINKTILSDNDSINIQRLWSNIRKADSLYFFKASQVN